jgi:hypothetical protein
MRRVEQVVREVKIVAGTIHRAADGVAPGGVVEIFDGDDLAGVGARWIAHPDPKQSPLVGGGI